MFFDLLLSLLVLVLAVAGLGLALLGSVSGLVFLAVMLYIASCRLYGVRLGAKLTEE